MRLISGRAVGLDADERSVELSGGRELAYATCLLATGAEPTRLPVPGADRSASARRAHGWMHVRELLARLADGGRVVGDRLGVHRLRDRRVAADAGPPGRR